MIFWWRQVSHRPAGGGIAAEPSRRAGYGFVLATSSSGDRQLARAQDARELARGGDREAALDLRARAAVDALGVLAEVDVRDRDDLVVERRSRSAGWRRRPAGHDADAATAALGERPRHLLERLRAAGVNSNVTIGSPLRRGPRRSSAPGRGCAPPRSATSSRSTKYQRPPRSSGSAAARSPRRTTVPGLTSRTFAASRSAAGTPSSAAARVGAARPKTFSAFGSTA